MTEPYICPKCEIESWHPMDAKYQWCAKCKDFTGVNVQKRINGRLTGTSVTLDTIQNEKIREFITNTIEVGGESEVAALIGINVAIKRHADDHYSADIKLSNHPNAISVLDRLLADETRHIGVTLAYNAELGVVAKVVGLQLTTH